MLYFLNEFDDITDEVKNDDYRNLRFVKRRLAGEFEDYNVKKLKKVLNMVEDLFFSTMTDN